MNYKNIFKRETKVIVYVVLALTLVVIGASYALFLQVNNNSNNQVVKAGSLIIEYSGGNKITVDDNAEDNCLMPQDDESGSGSGGCKFTLSVTNTGTLPMVYDLLIYDDITGGVELVSHEAIKHTLKKQKSNEEISNEITSKKALSTLELKDNKRVLERANIDVGETITFTLNIWIDEEKGEAEVGKYVSLKLDVIGSVYEDNTLAGYIKSLTDTSEDVVKIEHEATEQTPALVDYRYIGAAPNNYVCLEDSGACSEDQLYRIIGVIPTQSSENGEYENRVKLIKATAYGEGTQYGIPNDWTTSSLKNTLNTTYWDSISEYQKYIDDTKWYLGGRSTYTATTNTFYTAERGTTVVSGRPTSVVAKIGLMYPSDYGYAVGGDVRATCLASNLSAYNSNNCYKNDWLYLSGSNQWTLSPNSSYATYAFYVSSDGNLNYHSVASANVVRPVFYLKSNVGILAGDGTLENPFTLSN